MTLSRDVGIRLLIGAASHPRRRKSTVMMIVNILMTMKRTVAVIGMLVMTIMMIMVMMVIVMTIRNVLTDEDNDKVGDENNIR